MEGAAPLTMWRNSSVSDGRGRANSCTGPVASAAASTAWSSASAVELERRSAALGGRATRTPGSPSAHPAAPAARPRRAGRRRRRAARRPVRRPPSSRCGRCRPGRRSARPGRAGGWRTSPARPAAAFSRSTWLITSTATGSRPENGSSSTRMCGSCTSAAASWTRCWLPRLSFCTSSPRRRGDAEPLGPLVHRRRRRGRRHAVQPGQVDQLLADLHPRVEAALLGHVADLAPGLQRDRCAVPPHLAGVGGEHAERDPHRGGLAGAVAADEAEDLAGADVEGHVVERDHVAVPLRHPVDLQPSSAHRSLRS